MQNKVKPNGKATIHANGKTVELPVYSGTVGPDVVDIGKMYAQTGMFTLDRGFTWTASCESQITYIDGDAGILLHRGYPIEQLAEHSDYLESCYLLLNGELPTAEQKGEFDRKILRQASALMDAAGWKVGEGGLRRNDKGQVFTLDFIEDYYSVDEESGHYHYQHMACNMAFLCELLKEGNNG